MSLQLYIGPYLVVPRRLFDTVTTTRSCPAGCSLGFVSSSVKFCAHCGAALETRKVTGVVTRSPRLTELDNEWTDFMWQPEYAAKHPAGDIWLPNHQGHGLKFESEPARNAVLRFSEIDEGEMWGKAVCYYSAFTEAVTEKFSVTPIWECGIVAHSY